MKPKLPPDIPSYLHHLRFLRDNTHKNAVRVVFYDAQDVPTFTASKTIPGVFRDFVEDIKKAAIDSLNVECSYLQIEQDKKSIPPLKSLQKSYSRKAGNSGTSGHPDGARADASQGRSGTSSLSGTAKGTSK